MSSESSIIEAVLNGNVEAYSELVHAHQARVRLACLVWLANKEEADDAAQDVFIKAFKALAQFEKNASFLTWILRIADNHCRDKLRTRKSQRTESLDALFTINGEAFERLLSSTEGTERRPYTSDDMDLLVRLFAALSEEDREILALREVEALPYEAIAERLGCSLDAVKGRLKRARHSLLEKCSPYFS